MTSRKEGVIVVYFDQQTHACACVRMVENDQKHKKIMKKVPFCSCTPEAHERLTKKNKEKIIMYANLVNFGVFLIVFDHVNACASMHSLV